MIASRGLIAALVLCAVGTLAGAARADDPDAARAAYDRGTKAFEAKHYLEAANDFARADALAPNPVALGSALKLAALADDPVLAMTLADRAEARPNAGAGALAAAHKLREKFGTRAGKLSIHCAAGPCSATVDADPFPVEQPRWVTAGPHAVAIGAARYTVTVEGGKSLDWQEPAPQGAAPAPVPAPAPVVAPAPAPTPAPVVPAPAPALPQAAKGISPVWHWIGVGVTAVLGGVTIWSGVDTLQKHNDFENFVTSDPTSGQSAQLRTNVLIGVTSAAGAATIAIGVFATRWKSAPPDAAPVAVEVSPAPGGVALRGRF